MSSHHHVPSPFHSIFSVGCGRFYAQNVGYGWDDAHLEEQAAHYPEGLKGTTVMGANSLCLLLGICLCLMHDALSA